MNETSRRNVLTLLDWLLEVCSGESNCSWAKCHSRFLVCAVQMNQHPVCSEAMITIASLHVAPPFNTDNEVVD